MNERLSLQDLIDLLAKKQGVAKKDAETFLRELIAVISESIESNDSVRIKDFGVFKLIKVNARKSVDVNTGEAIEIPAHYKLSFTPDKSLKEAINRPFAHFESVILADGVSFENVESETEEDITDEQDDNADETTIEEATAEYIAVPEEGIIEVNEVVKETPLSDEEIEENPAIIEVEEETDINSVEENYEESITEITQEDIENLSNDPLYSTSSVSTDIDSMFYNHQKKSKRRRFISLGFIIVLILAAFAIGGYYFQELVDSLRGGASEAENKNVVITYEKQTPVDSLEQKQDSIQIKDIAQNTEQASRAETEQPKAEQKNEEGKVTSQSIKDAANPLATETIRSGHTLRNISLEYYGHKSFWVYIYEENKGIIKNANSIALGTKLIIPAPSKYGIDSKNPASVEKAKQREAKLFKEMGL